MTKGESEEATTIDTVEVHPFTPRIMDVPPLESWKMPTFNKYNRTTNPNEHISIFVTHVAFYTTNNVVWCKVFPMLLKGVVLGWITYLPTSSVDCFAMLRTKFEVQFSTCRQHMMTSIVLVNIRQDKGEYLHTFTVQFGKVTLQIKNLSPEVVMHHMVTASRPKLFVNNL